MKGFSSFMSLKYFLILQCLATKSSQFLLSSLSSTTLTYPIFQQFTIFQTHSCLLSASNLLSDASGSSASHEVDRKLWKLTSASINVLLFKVPQEQFGVSAATGTFRFNFKSSGTFRFYSCCNSLICLHVAKCDGGCTTSYE